MCMASMALASCLSVLELESGVTVDAGMLTDSAPSMASTAASGPPDMPRERTHIPSFALFKPAPTVVGEESVISLALRRNILSIKRLAQQVSPATAQARLPKHHR